MKVELKSSNKSDHFGQEIHHLYINGKTDGIAYTEDGSELRAYPWNVKQKHMKKLMLIKCEDFPDELRLWNVTSYKMPPGELGVFEIYRKGKRMEFEVWFGFRYKGDYNEKNWPLNPYLFVKNIIALSSGTVFKKIEQNFRIEERMHGMFICHTDIKGTIGDKFKIIYKALQELVNKAEKQIITEAKSYLKKKK